MIGSKWVGESVEKLQGVEQKIQSLLDALREGKADRKTVNTLLEKIKTSISFAKGIIMDAIYGLEDLQIA